VTGSGIDWPCRAYAEATDFDRATWLKRDNTTAKIAILTRQHLLNALPDPAYHQVDGYGVVVLRAHARRHHVQVDKSDLDRDTDLIWRDTAGRLVRYRVGDLMSCAIFAPDDTLIRIGDRQFVVLHPGVHEISWALYCAMAAARA
jgi:hypothetical protein